MSETDLLCPIMPYQLDRKELRQWEDLIERISARAVVQGRGRDLLLYLSGRVLPWRLDSTGTRHMSKRDPSRCWHCNTPLHPGHFCEGMQRKADATPVAGSSPAPLQDHDSSPAGRGVPPPMVPSAEDRAVIQLSYIGSNNRTHLKRLTETFDEAYREGHAIGYAAADGRAELIEALQQAILQIEYLHEKFGETGSGNAVLTRARAALTAAADILARGRRDAGAQRDDPARE